MSLFQKFSGDHKGSVPVVFACAFMPLIGICGMAVDYARATQARAQLQSAADSTVLMLARQAPKNNQSALNAMSLPYFSAVFRPDSGLVGNVQNVTKGKKEITLTAEGTVKTFFAGIFGWSQWPITVVAASAYGTKKIEVALVLDNTGSMASSNKIGELKKASKTLVIILQAASIEPGQVKIAIVPYTTRVNLGASYRNETWLTNTPTGSFMGGYNVPATRAAWGGCVADRDAPHNRNDSAVSVPVPQTLYPMVNCVDGLAQAQPLTENWSLLRSRIDAMIASGMTNITIGAQWGFEMLSRNAPFSEATADKDVERFMILLTDGDNTQDRWGAWDVARMDKDTKAMCDAITERGVAEAAKVHKIRLYTVLVIAGNESLLKSCATKPEMFYKVNNAGQLESVFKAIADEIGQVRLTM
ncbi:MAG: pilus assembly protein TadG-related protein [Rhabdaerophilum sp.]